MNISKINQKNPIFLIFLLTLLILSGCEPDIDTDPNENIRYYYPNCNNERGYLYLVDSVMMVSYTAGSTIEQIIELNKKYNLQLRDTNYMLHLRQGDGANRYYLKTKANDYYLRQGNVVIYYYLKTKANNYYTDYGYEKKDKYGNEDIVEFATPGIEYKKGEFNNDEFWLIDEFSAIYHDPGPSDTNKIPEICEKYHVNIWEILSVKFTNYTEVEYIFQVTKQSPFNALDMANFYHERYSIPCIIPLISWSSGPFMK